jgi:hypothetical protein
MIVSVNGMKNIKKLEDKKEMNPICIRTEIIEL